LKFAGSALRAYPANAVPDMPERPFRQYDLTVDPWLISPGRWLTNDKQDQRIKASAKHGFFISNSDSARGGDFLSRPRPVRQRFA